ncbi:hypothetical protein M422DRAFT_51340 [Sphaerobolus stellatus SS14]|uniref:Uncharacterized protein n=1 Tax=Sphaerobolus stellatus (strain SS14) TaxID=990650 RepID=A0A0C9VE80_SPHS4|nr:hypothetical protein M422DRAFT_51340 [Sphaerobolus stellatus SS14]
MFVPLLYLCLSFLVFQSVNATLVNVTVDDAGIDPSTGRSFVYSPEGAWSQGNNCSACTAKPDPSSMFDQTWHDVLYLPIGDTNPTGSLNISFTFNGSAIYVFCAIRNFTNMTFFIDNEPVNHFSREMDTGFGYNVPVFVNENLTPKEHIFTLMNGAVDGLGSASLVLFDYLIYSHEEVSPSQPVTGTPSPSTTPASQIKMNNGLKSGAIGGIAAGASILGFSLLAGILFWWRRRITLSQASTSESIVPFDASGSVTIGGLSTQHSSTDKLKSPAVSSRRDPTTVAATRFMHKSEGHAGSNVSEGLGPVSSSSSPFQSSSFQSSFSPSSISPPQVEADVGPLPIHPTENTLPPQYYQVFPVRQG